MLTLYRQLLKLYPEDHRAEFGCEMQAVFGEAEQDASSRGTLARAGFYAREIAGLLLGALEAHLRGITGAGFCEVFPRRRSTMRSEFRFPKFTPVLMTLILAGVVLAIEKATAIRNSVPDTNPHVGPIQPEHFTFFPAVLLIFAGAYLAGMIGWAILFALHRSGVHRLDAMSTREQ